MMNFVLLTLSFTVAILLASGLALAVVMNKHVLKWYMKKVEKMTVALFEESYKEDSKEEETV